MMIGFAFSPQSQPILTAFNQHQREEDKRVFCVLLSDFPGRICPTKVLRSQVFR
jgi:hypothetical protein